MKCLSASLHQVLQREKLSTTKSPPCLYFCQTYKGTHMSSFQLLSPAGVTPGVVRHWEILSALSSGLELSVAAGPCPDISWCLNLFQTSPGACSACVTSVTATGCLTKLILASWKLQLSSSCCLEGICHPARALRTPQNCLLPSALLALQASPKARNVFGEDWEL